MKRSSIWLAAMAAGASLCASQATVADDTISHVLGADNLETLYATVMPDGTIKLSHEAPKAASESSEAAAPNETTESAESSSKQHPEI